VRTFLLLIFTHEQQEWTFIDLEHLQSPHFDDVDANPDL
jgi:hypothetical protein